MSIVVYSDQKSIVYFFNSPIITFYFVVIFLSVICSYKIFVNRKSSVCQQKTSSVQKIYCDQRGRLHSSAGSRAQSDLVPRGDKQLVAPQGWLSPCLPLPPARRGCLELWPAADRGQPLLGDSGFISVPGDPSWVPSQRWSVSSCRSGGCDVFNIHLQVSNTRVFSRSGGQS